MYGVDPTVIVFKTLTPGTLDEEELVALVIGGEKDVVITEVGNVPFRKLEEEDRVVAELEELFVLTEMEGRVVSVVVRWLLAFKEA